MSVASTAGPFWSLNSSVLGQEPTVLEKVGFVGLPNNVWMERVQQESKAEGSKGQKAQVGRCGRKVEGIPIEEEEEEVKNTVVCSYMI